MAVNSIGLRVTSGDYHFHLEPVTDKENVIHCQLFKRFNVESHYEYHRVYELDVDGTVLATVLFELIEILEREDSDD